MSDLPRVLLSEEQLSARIRELGAEIREAYGDETIVVLGVLKGSIVFMADLIRAIPGPVQTAFLGVSSYEGTHSTGTVRITHDVRSPLDGHNVLIVEDIVDTGLTLSFLRRTLGVRNLKSLKVCALLDKPSRREVDVEVEFIGFEIPNEFVIGYGLDLDEYWRNLPYVGIFDGETL